MALELTEDRVQYGVGPLSTQTLTTLHEYLLDTSQPKVPTLPSHQTRLSPSLAALRLALLQRSSAGPEPSAVDDASPQQRASVADDTATSVQSLLAMVKPVERERRRNVAAKEKALTILRSAGGEWAAASEQLTATA